MRKSKLLTSPEERVDAVIQELLHNNRHTFDGLSTYEREQLIGWLEEAVLSGEVETAMHNMLWEVDYWRKPVPIEQFIEDEYYLGKTCSDLDPQWKHDLSTVFAPGSPVIEWVLTGAIGTGKTTLACVAMAYVAHRLSCLRNPAHYYGLLSDSLMVLGVYSITKKQVADGGYFKLRGFFDSSPYFRNEFPRNMKIDSKIQFTKSMLTVIPGSQELHALGLDLFSFCMDEVNFMRSKSSKEDPTRMAGQAYDLYNATYTRMLSRYMRPGGTMPGLMLLMSSRNSQTSFLETHLKKVAASPPEVREKTYISDYRLWEVKPASRFIKPKFRIEVGDRVNPSRILDDGMEAREGAKVIYDVPGEFYERFVEDLDQSMRDIAGEATYGLTPLIRDKKSVFDAVSEVMKHPFTRQTITIATRDEHLLEDYFLLETACKIVASSWVPKLNPNCPRFIHIDTSLTGDCTGMAMGHVAGQTNVEKVGYEGTVSVLTQPYVVIDFMLQIAPPHGDEIDLSKLRAFVTYLSSLYLVAKVSVDGYQSRDFRQILMKTGMDVGLLSVDRDDEAYMALRAALFERRCAMYEYVPFIDEVLELERVKMGSHKGLGKVDHPQKNLKGGKGSKDVSDAVAGVVWQCTNDARALDAAPPGFPTLSTSAAPRSVTDVSTPSSLVVPGSEVGWDDLRRNL